MIKVILRANSRIKRRHLLGVDLAVLLGLVEAALFSEVNAGAWSPRLMHGSSEELPLNLCCRTHGNSITAPEDFVQGHLFSLVMLYIINWFL
ncbi:hypothetical protein PoB_001159800 [Plakobranchus ocellatus]|uniref:Uncharacterized protein n=1 Tax=Plakobranchus ocellatus TaxID=259542 RepID=A0AAV3YRW9_9GAST|nr:hypothetical protein PoB_001159800 [Plakobranchus ocellatus]